MNLLKWCFQKYEFVKKNFWNKKKMKTQDPNALGYNFHKLGHLSKQNKEWTKYWVQKSDPNIKFEYYTLEIQDFHRLKILSWFLFASSQILFTLKFKAFDAVIKFSEFKGAQNRFKALCEKISFIYKIFSQKALNLFRAVLNSDNFIAEPKALNCKVNKIWLEAD